MAFDLDGMAVLRVIGANPHLFAEVTAEAAKVSRKLVVTQLKSSAPDVLRLREVRKALGRSNFACLLPRGDV